jgi:hypothetical protein
MLPDLVVREPFLSKGFGGLDVPTQRMVMARVFDQAKDLKVRNAIIRSLPVDMVNRLRRQKLTPEMLFHDNSVFGKAFISNADIPVSVRFKAADAAVRAVAGTTAELSGEAPGLSAIASEQGTTAKASERDRLSLAKSPASSSAKLDGPSLAGNASGENGAASDTSKARHDVTPPSDVVLGAGAASTASVPPKISKSPKESNKKTSVRTDSKDLPPPQGTPRVEQPSADLRSSEVQTVQPGSEAAPKPTPVQAEKAKLQKKPKAEQPEQTSIDVPKPDRPIDYESLPDGIMVDIKGIRASTGETITVQEDAKVALRDFDASQTKYQRLLECLQS